MKFLVSANKKYMLRLQKEDGNLCIYKYNNGKQGTFVWCSMAHGFKPGKFIMQTDGNAVVYTPTKNAKWSTKTHSYYDSKFANKNNKPVKLVLENDGKLKLYSKSDPLCGLLSNAVIEHIRNQSTNTTLVFILTWRLLF